MKNAGDAASLLSCEKLLQMRLQRRRSVTVAALHWCVSAHLYTEERSTSRDVSARAVQPALRLPSGQQRSTSFRRWAALKLIFGSVFQSSGFHRASSPVHRVRMLCARGLPARDNHRFSHQNAACRIGDFHVESGGEETGVDHPGVTQKTMGPGGAKNVTRSMRTGTNVILSSDGGAEIITS